MSENSPHDWTQHVPYTGYARRHPSAQRVEAQIYAVDRAQAHEQLTEGHDLDPAAAWSAIERLEASGVDVRSSGALRAEAGRMREESRAQARTGMQAQA